MSPPVEEQYKDLLCPVKDPEKSFAVNISELLENYLQKFVQGQIPPNFNSAALLLQGSSSIYGKKVEYLYNLASNLHEVLTKNKNLREDSEVNKKKDPKERTTKQSKLVDIFCSTEIKVGKNLSCLRKKNVSKAAAAAAIKRAKQAKTGEKKHAFVPVDLLPLEGEEKGAVFYDTRGEPVGNRNDYTLNKCRITRSGWLLMPTVSSDLLHPAQDLSSTSEDMDFEDAPGQDACFPDADEGYPASSGCPSTANPSQDVPSSQQSDEGLGSSVMGTPSEAAASQPDAVETPTEDGGADIDTENIPMEALPIEEEAFTAASKPRRSVRNALRQIQQEPERNTGPKEDLFAVRRPIEKNNTICYPPGMRNQKSNSQTLHPASIYCARTFFSVDSKLQKNDFFSLQVKAFANNSKFLNQIKKYKEAIKAAKSKKKTNGEVVSTDEEEEVEIEELQEAVVDEHSFAVNPNLSNDDFAVDNDPLLPMGDENPIADEMPVDDLGGDAPGADDLEEEAGGVEEDAEYERAAQEQMAMFRDELQSVEQTEQMGERVREWQKNLRPFLETISKREKFDINLYGSRILESFEENNRRQTKVFRDFCRGKEKWEIHRYFMALLPLVNVGNVSVANEPREDGEEGEEDIAITLLSRRMHHMELEEFGHGGGEHND